MVRIYLLKVAFFVVKCNYCCIFAGLTMLESE